MITLSYISFKQIKLSIKRNLSYLVFLLVKKYNKIQVDIDWNFTLLSSHWDCGLFKNQLKEPRKLNNFQYVSTPVKGHKLKVAENEPLFAAKFYLYRVFAILQLRLLRLCVLKLHKQKLNAPELPFFLHLSSIIPKNLFIIFFKIYMISQLKIIMGKLTINRTHTVYWKKFFMLCVFV